jgi:carboxyl-terminal processing protease
MMKRIIQLTLIFNSLLSFAGKGNNFDHHAPILKALLRKTHVSPPKEDSIFYNNIFNDFLYRCDTRKIYFLQSDIDTLKKYKQQFKDEVDGKNHFFFQRFAPLYQLRVMQCDTFVIKTAAKPFNFTIKESYSVADSSYCTTRQALETRCRQYMKAKCLRKLLVTLEYDSTATADTLLKKEPLMRAKTFRELSRSFDYLIYDKTTIEFVCGEVLCETIAAQYDPHTNYFTAEDNSNFKELIAGEEKLFGFNIEENEKGIITLNQILPGSPAWKCGDLNNGDVLIAAREEKGEWLSFDGENRQSAHELLNSINSDKIEMQVAKADGSRKNVILQREKIKPDDNFVRSWIIQGPSKIGYVQLPGFYTVSENIKGAHCADDVAKELVKLKAENIEGLILDIRNNGGGSMDEAQRLAGIFINEGVLDFVRYNEGKPIADKDPNQGVLFDKPMVVMINGASASASEMLAGTLQDYNRAIIMGSPSFGKATTQIVLPLDSNLNLRSDFRNKVKTQDYVKVTIGKLYRPSGNSNQLCGVQPDIELPDVIKALGYAEAAEKNCLPRDTVKRAVYFSPLTPLPVQELKTRSEARTKTKKEILALDALKTRILARKKETEKAIPLQWEEYILRWKSDRNSYYNAYKNPENSNPLPISNHSFDIEQMKVDLQKEIYNKKALKSIAKDPYIEESVLILSDLIQLQKK